MTSSTALETVSTHRHEAQFRATMILTRGKARRMTDLPLMRGFPSPPDQQVSLANWLRPPFNRWSFQHVREIVPTACIRRANWPATALRRDERTVERIAFQGPDGSEWTVGRLLAQTFTDGFLVLQRGHVVAESYDNGFAPEGRHIVFSVSKSITASLDGVLVDRG